MDSTQVDSVEKKAEPEAPTAIEIRIVLAGGNLTLAGPVHEKILCLGLLESAKEALLEMHRQKPSKASLFNRAKGLMGIALVTIMLTSPKWSLAAKPLYEESAFGQKSFGVAYPNKALTPGSAIEGVTVKDVCASGYARHVRQELSQKTKKQVYKKYGVPYDTGRYQIDHFIPISIGGSNEISNLWPQPILNNAGFLEKQQVANYLHKAVCGKKMTIQDAQRQIADNWHAVWLSMHKGKSK